MINLDYIMAQEKMKDTYREAEKARLIELSKGSLKDQLRQLFSSLACRLGFFRYYKGDKAKRYINIAQTPRM